MLLVALALFICFAQSLRIGNVGYGKPKDYESSLKLRLPKILTSKAPKANWIVIKSLQITPDPIVLGSMINVHADVVVGSVLSNSTFKNIGLTIETKTFGVWVEIPCVDGVGSCTIPGPEICGQLQQHAKDNCPKLQPYNLPCTCPFQAKEYLTPSGGLSIQTKNPGISWLTDGDFYIKAQIQSTSGELMCVEVYFTLSSN